MSVTIAGALATAAAVAQGLAIAGSIAANLQTVIDQWKELSERASRGEEISQETLDALIARSREMESATAAALREAAEDA